MTFDSPLSPLSFEDLMSTNITPPVHASTKKVSLPKQYVRHSNKQKREKEALQTQLVELQKLLKNEISRYYELTMDNNSTWKMMTMKHFKRRLTSEAQHQWLKTAIVGKGALIDDLIALIRQQLRTGSWITMQSKGLYDGVFLQQTDELLYAMYIHELDQVYAQSDAVFNSCGMDLKEETASFQQMTLTTNGDAISMQCGWKQLFPFEFKSTCDSMWMLAHLLNRQEAREAFEDVKDPERTIAAKFRVTKQLPGGESEALHHRFVQRRFVENDREVSVWKSSMQGDGIYRGLQMEETGW